MNNTASAAPTTVTATAPNGQTFTKAAVLRGYDVRYAILGRKDDTWTAISWKVDFFAAHRTMHSKKFRDMGFDEMTIADAV